MNRRLRMHTLVSHVRGPGAPVTFDGRRITSAIPIGVSGPGNMTVYFEVFTHAGTITITAIADQGRISDLNALTHVLRDEFGRIAEAAGDQPRR